MFNYDVIVVGAGHAGIEACLATARLGLKTLMVTSNISRIGYMSCNPSIGGLAKGHMVRELDVLGGQMGLAADATCIQYKRLNLSKGPAVRGTRMQSDKAKYISYMTELLRSEPNLSLLEQEVKSVIIEQGNIVNGVTLSDGSSIRAKAVIVTTGTFLNAVMHIGFNQIAGGRVGDSASIGLSDQLKDFGFQVQRLKTGTPARLDKNSINWDKLIPQWGDSNFYPFSYRSPKAPQLSQVACYLSRTSEVTHDIIRSNLHKSPLYGGVIEGVGPRYCPSIEDKIVKFADRTSHQTFLEPEGLDTNSIYLQGISTSLPEDVQMQFLKTIEGLENVKVLRYGYAVEYDFVLPTQIYHTLETRPLQNLFLAGQINGTSGYEEAAAQGFMAGVNAAFKISERDQIVLGRDQAYIGVLIDDLVTKGTSEPYRMLTSRAEHRLVLREDNTLDRLFRLTQDIGILPPKHLDILSRFDSERVEFLSLLKSKRLYPTAQLQDILSSKGTTVLSKSITFEEMLRRPEVNCNFLFDIGLPHLPPPEVCEAVEIEVKYSGYIKKQLELIEQTQKLEKHLLPPDLDYSLIKGLSIEEVEKLSKVKPRTIGQAQRVSGVNPSAIQSILVYLKLKERAGLNESTRRSKINQSSVTVENS